MTVDMPQLAQIPALRALWQQAFGDSDAFLDGFFATGFSPERCRCLSWNDRLAAALYWFDCLWQGRKLAYLYAVATEEVFRGKGFCRSLMEDTHRQLKKLGYHGAILVPGSRELFGLYEKLGYRGCCPMTWKEVTAAGRPETLQAMTGEEFAAKRREALPPEGVIQEGPSLSYLATFAGFFEAEDCLFCGSPDGDAFLFQEFFGPEDRLPGILAALQVSRGVLPSPGGQPRAMYFPLTEDETPPGYFGLALN